MRQILEKEMENASEESEAYQRYMWEQLRKSINGIINKVNVHNIQNVVVELFNENLIRGRGLLAKAIIQA
jgi:pre-mRNA-splicing factor CWC22